MTEEEMIALLAAGDLSMQAVWSEIIQYLRDSNELEAVEHALIAGEYDAAIQGINAASQRVAEEWIRQFTVAATAAARAASGMSNRLISYSGTNQTAVWQLDLTRLQLMSGLAQEQTDLINQIISRGLTNGINPRVMARDIVASLGLTPSMEQIVDNYRNELRTGQYAAAMSRALADGRYDGALRTGRPLTDAQVDSMTENYRYAWQRHRAETIARTEALTALHEGVEELFRQAFESSDLLESEIDVIWASALRLTTRESHREMHGQVRQPGESFESGAGYSLRYPGDPRAPASERANCLCVLQRRMRPRLDVALG